MSLLERDTVRRVQAALEDAGSPARIVELAGTARSAEDAAAAIGCETGRIVKSLVFVIGDRFVLALVAGDRRCRQDDLARVLAIDGKVRRPDADGVREATGFSIGGVAPLGHASPLPTAVDASLWRFPTVYAAAGHPHCVFPETPDSLVSMTGGVVSEDIAEAAP